MRFPISTREDWMQCDCLRFTVRLPTNVSLGVRCRQVSLESCVGPVRCLIIFGQGLFLNLSLVDEEEISSSPLGGVPQTSGSATELSVERWPLTLSGCASRHQEVSGRPTHRHDSTLDLTSFHVQQDSCPFQASQIFGDPSSTNSDLAP